MKNLTITTVILLVLALIWAAFYPWNEAMSAERQKLSGTVAYRERMALPPGAKVEVKLVDVSLMDAPSKTIAGIVIQPKRQVPVPFTLTYDPAAIIPSHSYALQARITIDGELMFITDQRYAVLTGGADETNLMLKRAGR